VRVDDGVKKAIQERTDIGEVIGAYVTLRKRGNDLVGLCPFHGEKSPSFHVHPDRGFYKCFGCGVAGDVFSFVQKHENVGFLDALRILGKRVGVELENEDPRAARARNEREAIYHANEVARAWFHRMLLDPREGAAARAYCEGRGITAGTIEAFSLGFAPDGWDGLVGDLRKNDVDPAVAVTAGLLKPSQRGGYYDFYRDRLMIPTLATTGETIAFGGRALGDGEPKYLNTSTTPVYTKGRYLFALNVARRAAAREDSVIVVEGYLDCIALHQAGFPNAVAALGTAFTAEQAKEVRKVASRAILCFDADAAGIEAGLKSIEALSAEGVAAFALRIPDGKDPDEFVRRNGADAFRALLADPMTATQVKIDAEIERRSGRVAPAALASWAEETIRRLSPQQEWDRWRVYAAQRLELAPDDLRRARMMVNPVHFAPRGADANASRHIVPAMMEKPSFERDILVIAMEDPALVSEFHDRLPPESLHEPLMRRVYERIWNEATAVSQPRDVLLWFAEDDEAIGILSSLGASSRNERYLGVGPGRTPEGRAKELRTRFLDADSRRDALHNIVARLARDASQRRYRELDAEMTRLIEAGERVPDDLRAEHAALAAELKGQPLRRSRFSGPDSTDQERG
jgi:DNA primase catalytic core